MTNLRYDLTQSQSNKSKNLARLFPTRGSSRGGGGEAKSKMELSAAKMIFAPPFKVKLTTIKTLWVYSLIAWDWTFGQLWPLL